MFKLVIFTAFLAFAAALPAPVPGPAPGPAPGPQPDPGFYAAQLAPTVPLPLYRTYPAPLTYATSYAYGAYAAPYIYRGPYLI